jgi:hypothetical protein
MDIIYSKCHNGVIIVPRFADDWLLFEVMVLHPMGVGVSIPSPLELGLDSQVSGLTSCGLLPIGMRKSSSEATRSDAIIRIHFPIIAIIVHF